MDHVLGLIPPNYFKLVDHPYQGGIGGAFLMYNDTKDFLIKILDVQTDNIFLKILS